MKNKTYLVKCVKKGNFLTFFGDVENYNKLSFKINQLLEQTTRKIIVFNMLIDICKLEINDVIKGDKNNGLTLYQFIDESVFGIDETNNCFLVTVNMKDMITVMKRVNIGKN
jgi:hypothetical protein